MENAPLTTNDLSDKACFALCYAQALIAQVKRDRGQPLTEREQKELTAFRSALDQLDQGDLSADDRRQALAQGLVELQELGVVECERDGQGDWVPTVVHEERIRGAEARLITKDLH